MPKPPFHREHQDFGNKVPKAPKDMTLNPLIRRTSHGAGRVRTRDTQGSPNNLQLPPRANTGPVVRLRASCVMARLDSHSVTEKDGVRSFRRGGVW